MTTVPSFSLSADALAKDNVYYALTMFPYPSGVGLHCGHASVFTVNDVIARFKRMQGMTVFNPFGFDAFGLPTENYAMKVGKQARIVTDENKEHFMKQVKALQMSFDYERIIDTSTPSYYHWTQWLFQELYKEGLVYRDTMFVNWCTDCMTVLANDQVVDGRCERCKDEVVQKKMPQWFIKITDYADDLIDDLDGLDWPESTKHHQKNWIGRSEGAEVDFVVDHEEEMSLTVFTTRVDTLFGVTALVLAPENTSIDHFLTADSKKKVIDYRTATGHKTAVERQQSINDKT